MKTKTRSIQNLAQFRRRKRLALNANPEGCNQYTGPGCGVGRDPSALAGEGKPTGMGEAVKAEILASAKAIGFSDESIQTEEVPEEKIWYETPKGHHFMHFSIKEGTEYKIEVTQEYGLGGTKIYDVQFSDVEASERFGITGKGSAHEVFSNVISGVVAYVRKRDPSAMSFAASETSRRKLYDRLVKTVARVLPDYSAFYVDKNYLRQYIVVKRVDKEMTIKQVRDKTGVEPSILVNQVFLSPEVAIDWWYGRPESVIINAAPKRTPNPLKRNLAQFRRRKRLALNAFCATGQGGGIDPTCSPGESKPTGTGEAVKAEILASAKSIGFSDELIQTEEVDWRDSDEIQERMTEREVNEMEEILESQRDQDIADMDIDVDTPDDDTVAEEAGWSQREVLDKAQDLIDDNVDDSEDKETLSSDASKWYSDNDASGEGAVEGLMDTVKESEVSDEGKEALLDSLKSLRERIEKDMDEKREEMMEQLRDEALDQARENYDMDEVRQNYLREFYDNNPDRYSSQVPEEKTWYKTLEGNSLMRFSTKEGTGYDIDVFPKSGPGGAEIHDVQFSDVAGKTGSERFGVTGKGSAHEVFSNVIAGVVAYAQKEDPRAMSFTADETSRRKLYDRVVKTVARVLPDYSAFYVDKENQPRQYVVVKRSDKETALSWMKTRSEVDPTILVNQVSLASEIAVDWWYGRPEPVVVNAAPNKRAPNPLKIDPTRTATLRRQFAATLRKRFRRLRLEIIRLIADEDALGLKESSHDPFALNTNPEGCNQYTGPGCGSGGGTKVVEAVKGVVAKVGGSAKEYLDKVPGGKFVREKMAQAKVKLEERYGKKTALAIIGAANAISWGAFIAGPFVGAPNYIPASALMVVGAGLAEGFIQARKGVELLTGNEETLTQAQIEELGRNLFNQLVGELEDQAIENAFCPTGPGGGVDPTCSPSVGSTNDEVAAAKTGDKEAVAKVVDANQGLVRKLATGYAGKDRDLHHDLIQEGNLGLLRAIQKFDPSIGNKFSTYAHHWIDGKIRNEINRRRAEEHRYKQAGEEAPEAVEWRESPHQADRAREEVSKGLRSLDDRSAKILSARFGLGGREPKTLEQLGEEHGLSAVRIQQIEAKALEKLRERGLSVNALNLLDGLAGNAFCATGPGGGVDPTCSPAQATKVMAKRIKSGGFTFVVGQRKYQEIGTKGFGVSPYEEHGKIFDKKPTKDDLRAFMKKNSDLLSKDKHALGAWYDPNDGKTHLDVVIVVRSRHEAITLGRQHNQISVFDFKSGKTIDTGGTGSVKNQSGDNGFGGNGRGAGQDLGFSLWGVANTRWKFHTSPEKVKAFQAWLKAQIDQRLRGKTEEELWKAYIQAGFKRGAGRAFDDVKQSELRRRRPELFTPEAQDQLRDFYAGTKDQFLRSAFNQPETVEKAQLLAGRSFDDLEGITDDMSTRMSRTLTDGLVQGKNPRAIADDLADEVDIGEKRAQVIARTEIIRAHAEGQLQALEELGIEEVGVAVEWSTAGNYCSAMTKAERKLGGCVCKLCESLEGVVLKLEEAKGLIPRHPNCVLPGNYAQGHVTGGLKAYYSGQAVELLTSGGCRVSLTVNHPVMTTNGLRRAGDLDEGDYLVCYLGDGDRPGNSDIEHGPTLIEEILESLHPGFTEKVPGRFDLYGDEAFIVGQIDVVSADPSFGEVMSGQLQRPSDLGFPPTHGSGVYGIGLSHSLFRRHPSPLEEFCFTATSQDNAVSPEAALHSPTIQSKAIRNGFAGFAVGIPAANVGIVEDFPIPPRRFSQRSELDTVTLKVSAERLSFDTNFDSKGLQGLASDVPCLEGTDVKSQPVLHHARFGSASDLDVPFLQSFSKNPAAYASFLRELAQRFPGKVAFRKVVKVDHFSYSGLVYDLETVPGYFTINRRSGESLFILNCRCAFIPANVGESDKDQKDTKASISRSMRESVDEEGGDEATTWIGADKEIDRSRPQSIFNVQHGAELEEFSAFLANANPEGCNQCEAAKVLGGHAEFSPQPEDPEAVY